ncbi:hypothetical protein KVR01_008192 [Diaporthe batatas]|uniref:uncharacterized protein n=1 Tax=Diaporthe batatas TaxID=748121 RepID=UPI001D03E9BD|nr:uncharacterized protein KVR01_008192 [Diaporthe batatas]KAG8162427.1 hypothetical protein KVR01_008192 [Diaporthe batatas]
MVKVAIAGGSGQVAREVIDALLAADKHEITVLSRAVTNGIPSMVHWRVVSYDNKPDLSASLKGVHTLLSFVQLLADPANQSQKNLIDAAIAAGVRRFAPSEYGSAGTIHMPWWIGKEEVRNYLRKVNENEKLLEYTLFQPGLFLDYLASPYKTARHVDPLDTVFDLQNCRAIAVDGHEDAVITFTAAADLASMVARAVDYEGEWPEIGGIRGNRVAFSQVIKLGEKIRGRPFVVDKVKLEDLEAGVLKTSWTLKQKHQAVPDEQLAGFLTEVPIGFLLSSVNGAWDISDEFNQLFPACELHEMGEFLTKVWAGKA